jgi:hypothetical protein
MARELIICERVADMPNASIPGSSPDGRCDICDATVWRSPSTKARKRSAKCRCKPCMRDTFTGDEVAMPLTALAIAELTAALKRQMS